MSDAVWQHKIVKIEGKELLEPLSNVCEHCKAFKPLQSVMLNFVPKEKERPALHKLKLEATSPPPTHSKSLIFWH